MRGRTVLLRDPEVKALLPVILIVCALLAWSLSQRSGLPWPVALEQSLLLGVSAQTTTGFSTLSVTELDATSKLVLITSMLIGGSTGSTAGGVKLLRMLVMARLLQYFLQRTAMPPHASARPRLAGRPLEAIDVELAALVVVLFMAAAGLSWLVFLAYGYPALDALFEVVSALGTVGLSTGIAAPDLETPLKLLLCVDMLLGRLELLALLVLLYPRTWIGRRS
jgi:trk system potassium uptake protein TrkH